MSTKLRVRLCAALALAVVLLALLSPWLTPYDPNAQDMMAALQPPSADHWLGTDSHGRDVLSRVIAGARTSVFSALILVAVSAVSGKIGRAHV